VSILDVAELHPKTKIAVPIVRKVISLYRQMTSFADQFNGENIDVADECTFTPENGYVVFASANRMPPFFVKKLKPVLFDLHRMVCTGGLTDFASNDGSSELLRRSREMEEVFVTYDAWGHPISPQHRFLVDTCTATFNPPDCIGNCTGCSTTTKVSCNARKLRCKGKSIQGISFPFMSDPIKVMDLLNGGDIQ
jgi:hypothetical protein